jgi:hypothetical protein
MIPITLHPLLLSWALWMHADHIHDGCPIAQGLVSLCLGEISFEHLVEIIREADEEFEESFRDYLEEREQARLMDSN